MTKKMTQLTLIVAKAANNAIGKDNALLWRLPEDLQHFKRTTLGAPIIMGRKTWDSIGRPLPGRRNIVVSRNAALTLTGAEVVPSLEAALALCQDVPEVFCIGGAQLYEQALNQAQRLVVTEVAKDFEGDAFFPPIAAKDWHETHRETHHSPAPNDFDYAFVTYQRTKPV